MPVIAKIDINKQRTNTKQKKNLCKRILELKLAWKRCVRRGSPILRERQHRSLTLSMPCSGIYMCCRSSVNIDNISSVFHRQIFKWPHQYHIVHGCTALWVFQHTVRVLICTLGLALYPTFRVLSRHPIGLEENYSRHWGICWGSGAVPPAGQKLKAFRCN